jgi:hypothetical protein
MKTIKSVILSSAAGLVAISGAQAADLPVKAKAVEYVRICSLYGAGFYYIPGTDTCLKIGGFLRADVTFNGGPHGQPAWSGDLGQGNRYSDYFSDRVRLGLTLDTRTATEYGVVRTFAQIDSQFTTQGSSTTNPALFSGSPSTGTSTALMNNWGEGLTVPEFLFIQFAGFTFGKSASAYSTPWGGYAGYNLSSYFLGGHDSITGTNNVQYTAQFGNGVSGTIGLDDSIVYNRTSVYNLSTGIGALGTGANAYGSDRIPDIVGNIRFDQAWGLFQLSAAAHDVSGSYNVLNGVAAPAGAVGVAAGSSTALSAINGHPDDKWGGAIMAALQLKNLPTGVGDDFKIDASYAAGDTKQVISASAPSPTFAMLSGASVPGAFQSVGLGATSDAVFLPVANGGTGDLKLTKAFGVRGGFTHNWDPYWSSSLFGSFSAVRYDGSATDLTSAMGQYCLAFGASHPGIGVTYSCNPNFNVAQLGINTRWSPVKNLTFAGELMWSHLDQKMGGVGGSATGTSTFGPGAPDPTATYQFKNQNTLELELRVQRNF